MYSQRNIVGHRAFNWLQLPKNKEMNLKSEPYTRKEKPTMTDINEYLRSLREGVGL
ncbi:hypothetical protein KSU07_12190 [Fusobacterium animalis]|uniref:hypothetical protein n=1 Tax=Fusobacterium animalis TaxID=76859 RepID=UPI0030CCAA7F